MIYKKISWSMISAYKNYGKQGLLDYVYGTWKTTVNMNYGILIHDEICSKMLANQLFINTSENPNYEKWIDGNIEKYKTICKIDYFDNKNLIDWKTGKRDPLQLYFYSLFIPVEKLHFIVVSKKNDKIIIKKIETYNSTYLTKIFYTSIILNYINKIEKIIDKTEFRLLTL